MKTSNNKQRLKTYKIKNHDSGKTYSVKAVNYTDAKTKYNKHILKDNRHTFEALWYTDPDYDKMMTQTFATEKEAMDFYRKNKGKPTFHGWWVTERHPGSWAVKKDLVMDSLTEDAFDYDTIHKDSFNDDSTVTISVKPKGYLTSKNTQNTAEEIYNVTIKRRSNGDITVSGKIQNIEKFLKQSLFDGGLVPGSIKIVNDSLTEDKLPLVEKIGDYTITKNDDDFLKFAVFYKGEIIAETTTISVAKKEINSHKNDYKKDSWTEVYKQFETLVDKHFPNTKVINEAVEALYKQHKGQADWDEAYKRWKSTTKDSITEDEQLKYQTTYRGEESQEIRLSEGSCYCNYDKTRNTTHVIFMGGQRNQTSRDFTIRGKITTVEQLKKEIDKHLKYLSSKDSIAEDAFDYDTMHKINDYIDKHEDRFERMSAKQMFDFVKKQFPNISNTKIAESLEYIYSGSRLKFAQFKDSLKTYKIKNADSGKTYRVKATSYTDAKDKYNKHILKEDSFTEDNSFNALFQFKKELNELSYKSDEQAIRSVFLKAETIARQVESSIKGLSREHKTKLANLKKDPNNNAAKTAFYAVDGLVYSIKYTLGDCAQFFEARGVGITRVLSVWNNGRIVGERFEGKTDKYLSMAKKYRDRFLQLSQQLNRSLQDSITEDALTEVQSNKLYKLLSKLDKYDLYEIVYGGPSRGSIDQPKRELLDDAFYELVDKSLSDVNRALSNFNLKLDSITEDADIAQTDIKSTYLPEDANADNIQYLGFNEKRKLSFYGYGDRYFVHYDLEGRTEEVDKETVQNILKKNILGEIDENDLINKEPQSEEIVSDTFDWKTKQERGDK